MVGARTFSASGCSRRGAGGAASLSALRLLCGAGRAPQATALGWLPGASVRGGAGLVSLAWLASVLQAASLVAFFGLQTSLLFLAICARERTNTHAQ